jgi:phage tail-like protein
MSSLLGETGLGGLVGPLGMSHRYTVEIDNAKYSFGYWAKVSGLSVTWERCELRTGDKPNAPIIFPGSTKYEPITLGRAACAQSKAVQEWLVDTSRNPQPLSGRISLVDSMGQLLVSWQLSEFFPIEWSIDAFDAMAGKPVMETLRLAHTGFLPDQILLPSTVS